MNVTVARYALGVASLLIVVGSMVVAAVAVRRRYLPEFDGAIARLAESVIAVALLIGLLEVVGTVGLFRLLPILVGRVAIGAGTHWLVGATRPGHARRADGATAGPPRARARPRAARVS